MLIAHRCDKCAWAPGRFVMSGKKLCPFGNNCTQLVDLDTYLIPHNVEYKYTDSIIIGGRQIDFYSVVFPAGVFSYWTVN